MTWTDADFYAGDGSISNPFVIHDKPNGYTAVEQFMNGIGDANYVGKGYYFQLGQDLDFDGITVKCVGSSSAPFVGTIDGNGYTIKNIHVTVSSIAVLVYGGANSFLKNCVFDGTVITSSASGWRYFIQIFSVNSCKFGNIQLISSTTALAIVMIYPGGTITDCIFDQNQDSATYKSSRLTMVMNQTKIYQKRILLLGTYYRFCLIPAYESVKTPYNNISDCMQLSSGITDNSGGTIIGRFCDQNPSYRANRDIHNCYAREDMTVGGSVPTQYCTNDDVNGESVSADVYQQKGFWDGTGVDGTVYLDWDFDNVWDWDEVNLKPVLRMTHAPIPSLVTGVWVKTENGWKQSTDLTYMR